MRVKLRVLITAISLVSFLSMSGAVTAMADAHHAGSSPSASLAGQSVVQGRMVWAGGRGVAGALVSLYAWPASSVLSALRPGQRVPWKLVGSAITARSGSYTIRVASPQALLSSAAKDGTVNLEVTSATGPGLASFSFPRRVVRIGNSRMAVESATSGATSQAGPAERVTLRLSAPRRTGEYPAITSTPSAHCGVFFKRNLGPHWDTVGQTYVATQNVTQGFTYHQGQSSTLGIGISATGKKGTFSAGGTSSESSNTSETFPARGHAYVLYQTEFTYGEYEKVCASPGSRQVSWIARATGYAGGAKSVLQAGPPNSPFCVSQEAGSTFTKNTTRAVTWSNGLSIPVLGLSVSSQTGYDSGASVTFHFGRTHRLCGTGGFPGGSPSRLVARN